jgi:hypothetical protein
LEIYVLLRIYTTGEAQHDTKGGNPVVTYSTDSWKLFCLILHGFGTYWIIVVLNNFNDYVCAAITVNYYFQTQITNIRIFCHCLGHNIGTIAWSIILLPILIIKLVFGLFDWLLTSNNPNACQRCCNKLFCCCCMCYEKLVDRFSENYFPVSYMGSEDMWPATTRYYYLSETYADETYAI